MLDKILKYFIKPVNLVLFILLLTLVLVVRFVNLNNTPPGVLVDGAGLGYSAYSILKTGHDEWNRYLPLTFKSFGDYKPPGFIYILVPFIKLFGLNPFALHFPVALAGIISIICVFFITKSLTKNIFISFMSAGLLAISPWHTYIHRIIAEGNVAMTIFLVGFTCLLTFKNLKGIIISAIFITLSMYTYLGYRMLAPIFIIIFEYLLWKRHHNLKYVIIFITIFFVLCAPIIFETVTHASGTRFNLLFSQKISDSYMTIQETREFCGFQNNRQLNFLCTLFWNKPLIIGQGILEAYLQHFYPNFIFYPGDTAVYLNNATQGGMYAWLIPFFYLGILISFKKLDRQNRSWLLSLLLIVPLNAIVGKPSYFRANLFLVPVVIYCALGISTVINWLTNKFKVRKQILITILLILAIFSYTKIAVDYFFVYTKKANAWDEEYPQLYKYLGQVEENYDQIIVKKTHSNAYIYYVFFRNVDPEFFQKNAVRENDEIVKIGKYQFLDVDIDKVYNNWLKNNKPKILYVGTENKYPKHLLYSIKTYNQVHTLLNIYDFNYLKKSD